METAYKILKILIAILLVAVVAALIWRFAGSNTVQAPVETSASQEAATSPEAAAQAEETAAALPQAPDFTVYDADGNAWKLSDFSGKPVILNFWASWCGPCKSEMPDIEEGYKTYGEEIHFLIVNLTDGSSETVETASAYIAGQGYTFPVYYDTDMDAALAYSIYAIPATYFIDANGGIVHSITGMMSADALQQGIGLLLGGA